MRRSRLMPFAASLLLLGCATSPSPSGSNPPPPPPPPPAPTVSTISVTPATAALEIGETAQLTAQAKDAGGAVLNRTMTWHSSATSVATVSTGGLVTAVAPGSATVTATSEGKSGGATITVSAPPVASLDVAPDSAGLEPGETVQLAATLRAANGAVLTGRPIAWSSSDTDVATVSSSGLVTAIANGGPVAITAMSEGKSDSALVTVTVPLDFAVLATGYYHTCALKSDGEAWCWGRNNAAQLGTGSSSTTGIPNPTKVNTALRFMSIVPSWAFTCGVALDGKAWCWGDGSEGGLGQGTNANSAVPVAVSGGHTFTSLNSGDAHVCGVTDQHEGWCWGLNGDGQLGNGSYNPSSSPELVSGGHSWQMIDTGALHACGLDSTGAAWCWGYGDEGQLGNGTTSGSADPVQVSGGHVFVELSVGDWHTCGREADGSLWCWGWNAYGQLGDGTTYDSSIPGQVSGGDQFAEVSASGWGSCGRLVSGTVKCWGSNDAGAVGNGSTTNQLQPVAVAGGLTFANLADGIGYHFCGLRTDGRVLCWGWNADGQLGIGNFSDAPTPTLLPAFAGLRLAPGIFQAPTAQGTPGLQHHRPRPQ